MQQARPTESLPQEVARLGIHVTLVEAGSYGTDWAGSSAAHATSLPYYDRLRSDMAGRDRMAEQIPGIIGDPAAVGPALLKVIDATEPPPRVLVGTVPTMMVGDLYRARLDTRKAWEAVSVEANGRALELPDPA